MVRAIIAGRVRSFVSRAALESFVRAIDPEYTLDITIIKE